MSCRSLSICVVGLFLVAASRVDLVSQVPDVSLTVPSVEGEPGQEVPVEFRLRTEIPIVAVLAYFNVTDGVAEFLRTDVSGTTAANLSHRQVIFSLRSSVPQSPKRGCLAGIQLDTGFGHPTPLPPGDDVLVFKVILRIRPDAGAGTHPFDIIDTQMATDHDLPPPNLQRGSIGELIVKPPTRPRAVKDLSCAPDGTGAQLTWTVLEPCDSIFVERNGARIAALAGGQSSYKDQPSPGPAQYVVVASKGGLDSFPARCELFIDIPRPAPVNGLTCDPVAEGVSLSWTNGEAYDAILLSRNGRLLSSLPGGSQTYVDPSTSSLFTIYTIQGEKGGVRTLPATCRLNEFTGTHVLWAEEVRAQAGATGVHMRMYATNPEELQGLQVALRVDPQLVELREFILDGTVTEAVGYDFFGFHPRKPGEIVAGVAFELLGGKKLPAGADQHVLTLVADILPGAPDGVIPVEFFVDQEVTEDYPPTEVVFTVNGQCRFPELREGVFLIGESPVPEVENALAREADAPVEGQGAAAGAPTRGILLEWSNAEEYDGIRIERDGTSLAEIPGDRSSYLDLDPGAGLHRYQILAVRGGLTSFPVAVAALPSGIPGTFVRGDVDLDGLLGLADAVSVILYLRLDGSQPACLDAADADDDGRVSVADALSILFHLFGGDPPLPPPGPTAAWFDATPDDLPCE